MAIDPATVKIIAQAAIKVATDEEMRKRLLIIILAPTIGIFLLITLIFYIVSSPFQAIAGFFKGDDLAKIIELRTNYGFNQTFDTNDSSYLESKGRNYSGVSFKDGAVEVQYYNQADSRWADLPYGQSGTIGTSGCGPTSLAIVVSSLTGKAVDPVQMSEWSVKNGYRCEGNGSYHSLIPAGAKNFGLKVEGATDKEPQKIIDALASGKLIIAIMSKGHFTNGGHFIVLRGITAEGKILVADPISLKRSEQEWDLDIILNEANKNSDAGGPFWIISK